MTVRSHKNLPEGFLDKLNLSAIDGVFEWSPDAGDAMILSDYDFVAEFDVKSILAVPLVEKSELIGVFALLSFESKGMFTDFSLSILTNFIEQIMLVLSNSKLFEEFTQRYFSTLIAMSNAYECRSPFTVGHSQRVANIAAEIAWAMKFPPKQIENVRDAGLIHDVGMCGVVDIAEGYQADYNHPEVGASMIEVLPISDEIIDGVKTHHEWHDGWGFPQGLKENQIPPTGRILSVAEFFAETTANSRMKKATTWERLLEELQLRRGSQFNPEVVDALISLITNKRNAANTEQVEPCWKFKGEPEDVCAHCPAYNNEKQPCWSFPGVLCEKHGDTFCDGCFIFNEWLERIKKLIDENKLEVKNMEHNILQQGDITVVRLTGEIDVTVAPELRNILKSKIDAGNVNIIVDLAEVDFIDSSGLGIFVVAYKSANAKGGNIKFANAKPQVLKVIELTRLDKHFEMYPSQAQAEMSFQV